MKNKILHIFNNQIKFSYDYFEFLLNNEFELNRHTLFQYSKNDNRYKKFKMDYTFSSYYSVFKHIKLLKDMRKNDKIIVHNLASPWLLLILFIFPSLNKKVYWVIWGKDLYFYQLLKEKYFHHEIYEFFRKRVFKNIKHIITFVKGDYILAKKWYGVKAEFHESFMYPSNLFNESQIKESYTNCTNILVGNSSDPSNNHYKIFEHLKEYKDADINIFVPLSYGNRKHAQKVIRYGIQLFGNKFKPMTNFMSLSRYNEFLKSINIAVFAHERQQAMGNTISLISLGKKVFMRNDTTSWEFFKDIQVKVFDIQNLNLSNLTYQDKITNQKIIRKHFSKENLSRQLNTIFNH